MREFPAQALPGVLAAIVQDGRLLLVQRAKEPDQGKWGLPGGMVETGETLPQAAIREVWEETSVQAGGGQIIDQFELKTPDGRYHYALSVVVLNWQSGTGQAGSDAAAVGWFTLAEMADLPQSQQLSRIARLLLGGNADETILKYV